MPCCRLDSLDLTGDSLILKIDVEGQELNVLNGATGLFAAGRVKAVFVDGYNDESVETFLRHYGFKLLDGVSLRYELGGSRRALAVRNHH